MKILVPIWYVFAIGPACILGNSSMNFFGPDSPFQFCGFPSIWSWQIFWWIVGIVMMWALAFKAQMATTSEEQIARADKEQMIVVKES